MPSSEYLGWIKFYKQRVDEQETAQKLGGKKNLLDNTDDLVKGLTR